MSTNATSNIFDYLSCTLCGFCEKNVEPNDAKKWPNHLSPIAHSHCLEIIQPIEYILNIKIKKMIEEHVKTYLVFNPGYDELLLEKYHIVGIKAVKEEMGCMSIKEFLISHGKDALSLKINTVGLKAVDKFTVHSKFNTHSKL